MIGPLLRVAASAAAAQTLRSAAQNAALRLLLALGASIAVMVGAAFLTASSFILLEQHLDHAAAWAILGAFWGLVGFAYFAAVRRRRR